MTTTISIPADFFGLRKHAYGVWDNTFAAKIVTHPSLAWCEENDIKVSFAVVDSMVERKYASPSGQVYSISHPEWFVEATFDNETDAVHFKLKWDI